MLNTFKIEILGKPYSLKGDTSRAELEALKSVLDKKTNEIKGKLQALPYSDALVLLLLNVAGDYVKENINHKNVTDTIHERTKKLIQLIDQNL
jgi:cell division protein ZapA (FtsZ GTPase activity inhibitor)